MRFNLKNIAILTVIAVTAIVNSPLLNVGPLAQLVEQLTLNQRVAGSIPARPSVKLDGDAKNYSNPLLLLSTAIRSCALGNNRFSIN
jgi:hypothetical protein